MFKEYWQVKLLEILTIVIIFLFVLQLTGCAISYQKFKDTSFEEDLKIREVIGRRIVMAPPFGSKVLSKDDLDMYEDSDGWQINMGSKSNLDGGKLSPKLIEVFNSLVLP